MKRKYGGSGLGFFFALMLVSAILGGFVVLLGLKYTDLGTAVVPQKIVEEEQPVVPQLVKAEQPATLAPEQLKPAKALEQATINVVKSVGPAVVMITTREQETVLDFFFQPMTREWSGLGSGVIFDKNGYILTNNHVIAGRGSETIQITVVLSDGRHFPGKVVGADPLTDLAVVKIDGRDLPVARLGDSDRIQVGQLAVAIGNPLGENLRNTVTMGVISAVNRTLQINANQVMRGMIQTDASINPGNSGGPLLNTDGEVIGINTAIVAQAQGIGFAIPINTAKEVAKQLIAYGRVQRPGLGITYKMLDEEGIAWLESATRATVPAAGGALIVEVNPGSGAEAAGLRPYDLLVQIAGQEIGPHFDLAGFVAGRRLGERLSVVFYRLERGTFGRTWRKMTATVKVGLVR
ncbi:MAG: trypsin-like serine protease [Firmicutes bacterium]|nr:trypsin-like serine protease [Bacillota bacterium]